MREGDIEALRNKMRDMGRPIKSTTIIKGGEKIYYKVGKKGQVTITERSGTNSANGR